VRVPGNVGDRHTHTHCFTNSAYTMTTTIIILLQPWHNFYCIYRCLKCAKKEEIHLLIHLEVGMSPSRSDRVIQHGLRDPLPLRFRPLLLGAAINMPVVKCTGSQDDTNKIRKGGAVYFVCVYK
jgi:hypothetical protein